MDAPWEKIFSNSRSKKWPSISAIECTRNVKRVARIPYVVLRGLITAAEPRSCYKASARRQSAENHRSCSCNGMFAASKYSGSPWRVVMSEGSVGIWRKREVKRRWERHRLYLWPSKDSWILSCMYSAQKCTKYLWNIFARDAHRARARAHTQYYTE